MSRKPPPFKSRWHITGTLTTTAPLHIGDGFSGELHDRSRPAQKNLAEPEHDAQTICVDHQGRAYLLGSSLRGVLRSALPSDFGLWSQDMRELFGHPRPDDKDAVGGRLIVYDAFIPDGVPALSTAADPAHLPYWDQKRRTCVAANVSLDRRTRTAADKLLYHTEYVPAGTTFAVELVGDNLSDAQVSLLLSLLSRFKPDPDGLSLGAGQSNGWGKLKWKLGELKCLTPEILHAWKTLPTGLPLPGAIDPEAVTSLEESAHVAGISPIPRLDIALTLYFPGPLLIRDPKQASRADKARANAARHQRQVPKLPNAIPITDPDQRPVIPSTAVRGVLRSRLEMILRTIGQTIPQPADQPSVSDLASAHALNLAALLFGATGWRGSIDTGSFCLHASSQHQSLHQDFVAIDRFTGSVAGSKKFDVKAIVGATMTGQLTLDLSRLPAARIPEILRHLALVLRDLREGDLYFGSGASKGYGQCVSAHGTVIDSNNAKYDLATWINKTLAPSQP